MIITTPIAAQNIVELQISKPFKLIKLNAAYNVADWITSAVLTLPPLPDFKIF